MKKIKYFLVLLVSVLFFSCDFLSQNQGFIINNKVSEEVENPQTINSEERLWTILIYMCADNNLESAAINDIYEMECSNLNTDVVTVLMLVDRSSAYSTACDNWSGTKLFKLQTGRKSSQNSMISIELDCSSLGLVSGDDKELDLSDSSVLENFINYSINRFPAANYGLIMWGHGSGWKNDESSVCENIYKGFSYDETSNSYMTLKQFGSALKNCFSKNKLNYLGFDTCYGAEIEVMYEIKDCVDFACGSEGLVSSGGWNYENLFSTFQEYESKTVNDLLEVSLSQFQKQYANTLRSSFAICDLSKIENYFNFFDLFTKKCADLIVSSEIRDSVYKTLFSSPNCKTEKYTFGTEGYDVYLDCVSVCENLNELFLDSELQNLYESFLDAHNLCIAKSWASDRSFGSLGVYFQTFTSGNLLQTSFNANYVKGKTFNQIDFITQSSGYVPTSSLEGSLLDKIFYYSF